MTSVCCTNASSTLLEYGKCRQYLQSSRVAATGGKLGFSSVRRNNRLQSHVERKISIGWQRNRIQCETRAGELSFPDAHGGVKEIFSKEEFDEHLKEAGDKLVRGTDLLECALGALGKNELEQGVVLDISTRTCGPCKMIYPKLVKMSEDYPDAVFLKINGDHSEETRNLMKEWGVRAVPNFRFFRNGEKVHSHSGAKEDDLRTHFLKHYDAETAVAAAARD